MEVRGFEPLCFDLASGASPGAAGDLISDPRRAPARSAAPSSISFPLGTRALPRGLACWRRRTGAAGTPRATAP